MQKQALRRDLLITRLVIITRLDSSSGLESVDEP